MNTNGRQSTFSGAFVASSEFSVKASDFPEFFRRRCQDFAPAGRDQHRILNPNATPAFDVDPRLDCDGHAWFELRFVLAANAWEFMNFKAKTVAGGMNELPVEAVALQGSARGTVHRVRR